jgi:hypothetical protein
MIGLKVECKYATNGTGTIIKKHSNTGWIVSFETISPHQDFRTLVIKNEVVNRTMYMKSADIKIVN